MADLERALQIAVRAHAGQKDKNGEAYIFHPLRVMGRCVSPDAKIVALLHDVVEDTEVTAEQLKEEGFSAGVLAAVKLLTHATEISYDDYVSAMLSNPTAVEVKIADLEDNSDIRRLKSVDEKGIERLRKYRKAYQILTAHRDGAGS